MALHHIPDSLLCLLPALGDDDAFAQSQAVCLDDRGNGSRVQVSKGRIHIPEHLVAGRGDMVFFHQFLGEHLAAFQNGRIGPGAEAGNALGLQSVHGPQHQGVVRSHHGVIYFMDHGEVHDSRNVLGPDVHTLRFFLHSGVSGQGKNCLHIGIFPQGTDDGVFPSAAAND